MERGRKNRRGRARSRGNRNIPHLFPPPPHSKPETFLNNLCSFVILSTLIALVYLMLQYHCQNCNKNYDMNNISQSLNDIAKNLSVIKDSYYDLELKISRFSQELPKLEGQLDILEAFANMEKSHLEGWDTKTQMSFPDVDVYLNKPLPHSENKSDKCSLCTIALTKPVEVNQD